jgi:outer membrane biosynthesis protein TonB
MSMPQQEPQRPRRKGAGRMTAVAASVAVHAGVVLVLFSTYAAPPVQPEPEPVSVTLLDNLPLAPVPEPAPTPPSPKVTPVPEPPAAPKPTPLRDPPPRKSAIHKAKIPPRVVTIAAAEEADEETVASELSDSQLGGATTAGSGPSGRGCDMVQALQNALRKDRLVQAAVAEAHTGKAMLVWNGDWVKSRGQEGKGLAAVRQAIMWQVAFSPESCRTEPVRGLVLISLNDGPGAARLAVGGGQWRWSDLVSRNR